MDNIKVIKNLVFGVIKEKNLTKFKDILSQLDESYIHKLKYGTENMLEISYRLNAHDISDYLLSITDVDAFIVKSAPASQTLLMEIIQNTFLDDYRLSNLLNKSKDINMVNTRTGATILYTMCNLYFQYEDERTENSIMNVIKTLMKHGADPFIYDTIEEICSIHVAVIHLKSMEILMVLLDGKIIGRFNMEILINALYINPTHRYDILELMLKHVEDINALCENHTLLWHAKTNIPEETDIIELLEMSGAIEM